MNKMGTIHNDLVIKTLFPNQNAIGVDLGNIEIKKLNTKYNRINFKRKDYQYKNLEYILVYNPDSYDFYLLDKEDIPPLKHGGKIRVIYLSYIKNIAIFHTTNEIELLEKLLKYMKEPKIYNELYNELYGVNNER